MAIFDTITLSDELKDAQGDETASSEADKLILQDVEYGSGDLAFAVESIQDAARDLSLIGRTQAYLQEARTEPSIIGKRLALAQVQRNHSLLRGRYPDIVFSTEAAQASLDGAGLVIALEEEETKSKGFFEKIFEKICKAFKWLWEKLTGLFSSGKNPDKTKEELEKEGEKLKDAVDNGGDPNNVEIETFGFNKAFSFLGHPLTLNMVTEHHKHQSKLIPQLLDALKETMAAYDAYIASLREIKNTPDSLNAALKKVAAHLGVVMAKFPLGKPEDFEAAGHKDLVDYVKRFSGSKVHTLTGFTYGHKLVMASVPKEDGTLEFKVIYSEGRPEGTKDEIADTSHTLVIALLTAAAEAMTSLGEARKDFTRYSEDGKKKQGELDGLRSSLSSTDTTEIAKLIGLVGMYSTTLGAICLSIGKAYSDLIAAGEETSKFIKEIVKAIENTEGGGGTETEEAKPEATSEEKPAETPASEPAAKKPAKPRKKKTPKNEKPAA